jgi:hypothetical protein
MREVYEQQAQLQAHLAMGGVHMGMPMGGMGVPVSVAQLNVVFLSLSNLSVEPGKIWRHPDVEGVAVYLECLDSNKSMHRPF